MEYLKLNIEKPVQYISGGQFITNKEWKHEKRVIDSYEMIIGVNDTLYIEQDGIKYEVKPGEVLFILPHTIHKGYKICNKFISFYWFHFISDTIYRGKEINDTTVLKIRTTPEISHLIKDIYLPRYGSPIAVQRLNILANQLLDVDNSNYYTRMSLNYLMTSLLIELSEQTFLHSINRQDSLSETDINIHFILEWTRINAFDGITVSDIAEQFSYNKDYLSRHFKQRTGKTLQSYLHSLRISKAKDLLTGSRQNIKVIANRVGIDDEKYFMRLFKKYEKITPTEYRKAFSKTHLNNK
ncbi:AraC-type DNA-binding protein [Gracilibacillus ureilyticus]|uniref:AraC-type DNA-binding protein n=1 Tax=Gracilibacillus ureilyticus TaxID=531814 RepID=A0A1H9T127_9BACI|nr:AraC family transcriptional regulator [Gracilibacillus ureilyticus]SER90816.1 AraC-type DNA-binding protein [Gracilibacillus ureilyticus]